MLAVIAGIYESGGGLQCSSLRFEVEDPSNILCRVADCALDYLGIDPDANDEYSGDFGTLVELVTNDSGFVDALAREKIYVDNADYALEVVDYYESWM